MAPCLRSIPSCWTSQADYLFGAPAGDLPIEGERILRGVSTLAGYPGYRFGRHDDPVGTSLSGLPDSERTDASGAARLELSLPEFTGTPHPREVTIIARVTEGSGRPVERQITRALEPTGTLIGIRPLFDGTLPEGTEAQFSPDRRRGRGSAGALDPEPN